MYLIDSCQDHITWHFFIVYPNCLLSRQFNPISIILSMHNQLTPFKTIWPDFCILYPIDSFQYHYDLILSRCIHLTPFKSIWPNFIIVYPTDSFQGHIDLIFVLYTKLTPFKTIWPNFINVYPIDFFQDHMNWFLHCVPNLCNELLSRPFDLIFAFYTKLTPFKTIWPDFCIVYLIDSCQDHISWFLHCVP